MLGDTVSMANGHADQGKDATVKEMLAKIKAREAQKNACVITGAQNHAQDQIQAEIARDSDLDLRNRFAYEFDQDQKVRGIAFCGNLAVFREFEETLPNEAREAIEPYRIVDRSFFALILRFEKVVEKNDWRIQTIEEIADIVCRDAGEPLDKDFDYGLLKDREPVRPGQLFDLDAHPVKEYLRSIIKRAEPVPAEPSIVDSYIKIDRLFVADPTVDLATKGLYYYLHSLCHWPKNQCWPSISKIADELGIGRSKVVRLIEELEQIGAIKVVRGTGRANNKYVLVHRERVKALVAQGKQKNIQGWVDKKRKNQRR
jgi:hypothetical protein